MKLCGVIYLAATLLAGSKSAESFVPNHRPLSISSTSTELNIFGLFQGAGSTKVEPKDAAKEVAPLPTLDDQGIRDLFYLWNDALKTKSPQIVAKRYSKKPVLLPTVSDTPRMDYPGILNYFESFLKMEPQGEILLSKVISGPGWAQDVGLYEFSLNGGKRRVKARYSFTYIYEEGEWRIQHHHSSQMPEEIISYDAPKITSPGQVRNLFYLWNDALDTLDADVVASRFSKNAVLLPTVSDIPRTDYESIRAYFVDFLKLKPQGVILESHVEYGPNWAKDVGVYEFTLRSQPEGQNKVKARYSFVYTYEDGQWKIAHQHSSKMPEIESKKLADCEEKLAAATAGKDD